MSLGQRQASKNVKDASNGQCKTEEAGTVCAPNMDQTSRARERHGNGILLPPHTGTFPPRPEIFHLRQPHRQGQGWKAESTDSPETKERAGSRFEREQGYLRQSFQRCWLLAPERAGILSTRRTRAGGCASARDPRNKGCRYKSLRVRMQHA